MESIQRIKDSIQSLTTDATISILQAKEEFDNSRCNLDNPNLIKEEVEYQKEIFSKLKFQYLEQETRDKFLRRISENDDIEIGRQNVDDIAIEAGEKKQQLKRLKLDLSSKIRDLEEIIEENITLNEEMNTKKESCDKYIEEIETMETEIDDLIEQNSPLEKEIINCIEVEKDIDVEDLKNYSSGTLEREEIKLKRLNNEINLRKQMMEDQQQYLQELHEMSSKLDQSLNDIEPNKTPNKSQIYAKWCKEMNDLFARIANIDELIISIPRENSEQQYDLKVKIGDEILSLSFTKNFKITTLSNNKYSAFIDKINLHNCSTMEEFVQKLAKLINIMVKKEPEERD